MANKNINDLDQISCFSNKLWEKNQVSKIHVNRSKRILG